MSLFDPIKDIVARVVNKLKELTNNNELASKVQLVLTTELRRVTYALRQREIDLDEAKDYIRELVWALVGDIVDDETRNEIVDMLVRAVKLETTRESLGSGRAKSFSGF